MRKPTVPWDEKYVGELRKHLSAGNTFPSFAEKLGVHYSRIFGWTVDHPEFEAVRKEYDEKRRSGGKSWRKR